MDSTDIAILKELDKNSRATASEISKRVNLSVPAVSERIRKLEDQGIIEGYTVKVNRKKLDYTLVAYIFVTIDTPANTEIFRQEVVRFNEVLECNHLAGAYDYMLKVWMQDTDELESFISEKLKSIKGIQQSNTMIQLSSLKHAMNRMVWK